MDKRRSYTIALANCLTVVGILIENQVVKYTLLATSMIISIYAILSSSNSQKGPL
ncbi:hypothetical protein GCM10028810_65800 [Spirosoma litoris]